MGREFVGFFKGNLRKLKIFEYFVKTAIFFENLHKKTIYLNLLKEGKILEKFRRKLNNFQTNFSKATKTLKFCKH